MAPSSRGAVAMPGQPWTWLAPVAVGIIAIGAYANSLSNGFVWDDPIILNRQLVVFQSLSDVLIAPRGIPQFSPDYYRPLTIGSYLLDRAIGGADPFFYHLSVVLIHAVTVLLVYALGRQIFGRDTAGMFGAVAAAALFAVHPIHSESVAWIAGRSDVLATCFLVAALVVHGRGRFSWTRSGATGVLAGAALGAKENAVTLYPLLVLMDGLVTPGRLPRPWQTGQWVRRYMGPVIAAGVYLLLRRLTLGEFIGTAPSGDGGKRLDFRSHQSQRLLYGKAGVARRPQRLYRLSAQRTGAVRAGRIARRRGQRSCGVVVERRRRCPIVPLTMDDSHPDTVVDCRLEDSRGACGGALSVFAIRRFLSARRLRRLSSLDGVANAMASRRTGNRVRGAAGRRHRSYR